MEQLLKLGSRLYGKAGILVAVIVLLAAGFLYVAGLSPEGKEEMLWWVQDYLPIFMFLTLAVLLFSGFPVAFILGGLALLYGFIGYFLGVFSLIEFFNFLPRIWGQAAENLVLVSVPAFVFMGVMMERSGVANDLLYTVQVLLKRVPGALALAVTIMGTILAAMTGIIGASVTMMTALALPTMMRQGYSHSLACGTIAASGTLGILIPPSIMLIIMADLLQVSVGNVFMAALVPGLTLAFLYLLYVWLIAWLKPSVAPPLPPDLLDVPREQLVTGFTRPLMMLGAVVVAVASLSWLGGGGLMPAGVNPSTPFWVAVILAIVWLFGFAGPLLRRAFLPPVVLITLIKGSILFGWATPSEAGAVGAFGAIVLAAFAGRLDFRTMQGVCHTAARTVAMIFFIIISATSFAYVYRSLGGDDVVERMITQAALDSWGLLILLMLITFVLGFFLDWIEITLIVLPVFAPLVAGLDFDGYVAANEIKIWFLILMAVNLQTSFLTPPFGFALFYLKGIAPREIKIQSIYKGIIPFVLLQLLGLIMIMWQPEIALWLQRTVYQ
ncbi:MAG: TRAP transporter large permease subunit [Gammaproteobacteria bacterium]|nr:MAG: TRAP transporter large permease subunit [Gammaproteobacteria bacterium]